MSHEDHVKVNGLSFTMQVKHKPWSNDDQSYPKQTVKVSVDIVHDITTAAASDDYTTSVDYVTICAAVQAVCNREPPADTQNLSLIEELAEELAAACMKDSPNIWMVIIEVELPKGVLSAGGAGVRITRTRDGRKSEMDCFYIKKWQVRTFIGAHEHELRESQPIVIDLSIDRDPKSYKRFDIFPWLTTALQKFMELNVYRTAETIAAELIKKSFELLKEGTSSVTVELSKPVALLVADTAQITLTRSKFDLEGPSSPYGNPPGVSFSAIAIGSNVGDRFKNIETALRVLENPSNESAFDTITKGNAGLVTVTNTSFMYETSPMYVLGQPNFINCACMVTTTLSATELLKLLKAVESFVGRVPGERFGPRIVDLDVITFNSETIDTRSETERENLENLDGHLVVPHPRMLEREFVLRPLNDIIPDWLHPHVHAPIRILLDRLLQSKPPNEPPMSKVIPFPSYNPESENFGIHVPSTLSYWVLPSLAGSPGSSKTRTYLMATLNTTPDSFSDGGLHTDLTAAMSFVSKSVAGGADIIDIGGYSTRPGAAFVSIEEEIKRVVPVILAIRESSDEKISTILISIDTFRPEVARAAVRAGANCINDVHAFSGPGYPPPANWEANFANMRDLARSLAVPVIMMHSRGDAGSNKDYSDYPKRKRSNVGQVIDGIRIELGQKVQRAIQGSGGVRRWLVMVDPGVGFSKTTEDNLEILRHASSITADEPFDRDLVPFTFQQAIVSTRSPPAALPPLLDRPREPLVTSQPSLAGFPLLIGASRKSFLGKILSQPSRSSNSEGKSLEHPGRETNPNERVYATAATVACAVQQGAAVVRVHDVEEMADVVKIASALWI
ncbi:Dihydropteroate synthase [Rickenella mellea]|uniref:Dihydropteroate synthase n=1 Tax=Rickenella mellea TaxID=50990 RepID=A0A4Y7QM35_9AGAM|nr:Dihydropteroate synthase [Rickenella mellea]